MAIDTTNKNPVQEFLSEFYPDEDPLKFEFDINNYRTNKDREIVSRLLKDILKRCPMGNESDTKAPSRYERICYFIIKITFENDFPETNPQHHIVKDLTFGETRNIRDIVVDNHYRDSKKSNFWNDIKTDKSTQCQTIVFECKNYNYNKNQIGKEEVLQVYNYLDPDSFGKLGFLICRNTKKTLSESAKQAIIRVRKDGYYIIPIDDLSIGEWIDAWCINKSPLSFFNDIYLKHRTNISEGVFSH